MSRPSQTENAFVQNFVRSKFSVRSSCVQKGLCLDFGAFKSVYVQTFVCTKKIVRSKIIIFIGSSRSRSNLTMVVIKILQTWYQETFYSTGIYKRKNCWSGFARQKVRYSSFCSFCLKRFLCVHDETILRSKLHMSRLACVQNCLFPDFHTIKASYVQISLRSKLPMFRPSCAHIFSRRVILNSRHPHVRSFCSRHINFRSGTSARDKIKTEPLLHWCYPGQITLDKP